MISVNDEKELGLLRKFQEMVSDLDQDETTCLRFLIAREFDLTKAEEMIRENQVWRKEVGIENIYKWTLPEYVINDLPHGFPGQSKIGGPVLWLPLGRWLARHWVERGKKEEITQYGFRILESALVRMTECGDKPMVAILCMKELTYWKVANMDTLRVLFAGFQALERNYPEILQHLIVINAPWAFTIAFNFIKPILSQRTLDKFQIHGADKSKWLPALRETCEECAIPQEYLELE